MKDCVVLSFRVYEQQNYLEGGKGTSDTFAMANFPQVQERINTFLAHGYVIKGFSVPQNQTMYFCLEKDD